MKAIDIINRSLRLIGAIGTAEHATDDESQDCLLALNQLISSWNANKLFIYAQKEIIFPSIAGKASYTIGEDPLADIQLDRPDKVTRAYRNDSGEITELSIVENSFYQLQNSLIQGIPANLYYNPTFPLGTIYLSPTPQASWDINLSVYKKIPELLNIDDEIEAPGYYLRALTYNLAIEVAPEFGLPVSDAVLKSSSESLLNIKRMNSKTIISQIECGSVPVITNSGFGTERS